MNLVMSLKKLLLFSCPVFSLFFLSSLKTAFAPESNFGSVKGANSVSFTTQVSATVGENYLTITGYTSPQAKVILSSSAGNLYRQTFADNTGYFVFQAVLFPQNVGELSLISQDTNGFSSTPLFLPAPPPSQDVILQGLLMPPTIGLSTGENSYDQPSAVAGKTFPKSPVLIYLYADPEQSFWSTINTFGTNFWNLIVHQAFAKSAPRLEIESDENGDFEVNLPSVEPAMQKIFVASLFDKNYSPKSFTLTFATLSIWGKIGLFFRSLWEKVLDFFRSIAQDPTKIIWLEIPLLAILFLNLTFRWAVEKVSQRNGEEERTTIIQENL